MIETFTIFLYNIIFNNIPLLYGTVGEIITEKSGSLNLGVEGTMAIGAVFGYILGCQTNSILVGILAAFFFGALCGALFSFLTVTLQANQNVTGLTITTFGVGFYFFVGNGLGSDWPVMFSSQNIVDGFAPIEIPLLSQIPILGEGIFSQNLLVYLGVVIALLVWFYLKHTRPGLKLRAVGENPAAADSVGINITLYKYLHIMLGSGIMGIGGYYMGLKLSGSFEGTCWINGYGWISVALVIFANWSAAKAILGTLIFGFFNTLQVSKGALVQTFPNALGWLSDVPIQLFQALPFIITAIVLIVGSVRKNSNSGEPAAVGLNYFREDR